MYNNGSICCWIEHHWYIHHALYECTYWWAFRVFFLFFLVITSEAAINNYAHVFVCTIFLYFSWLVDNYWTSQYSNWGLLNISGNLSVPCLNTGIQFSSLSPNRDSSGFTSVSSICVTAWNYQGKKLGWS